MGGYSVGRPWRNRGFAVVPLHLVDDELEMALKESVAPGPLLYRQVDGDLGPDPGWDIERLHFDGGLSWGGLLEREVSQKWQLRHVSGATRQVRRTQYTCDLSVADLLARPLDALHARLGGVMDRQAILSEVLVTDLSLTSEVKHPVIGRTKIGARPQPLTVATCLGSRTWRVLDVEAARLVGAALILAEFTAVGSLVTYGFGQVQARPLR